jgi:hypothetical protein
MDTAHRELLHEARRQLDGVIEAERRYLDEQPFRLVHGYDPRAGVYTVRVQVERAMPDEVSALAAGVLRAARTALDALAAALVSGAPAPTARPRFPIHETLPEFAQRSRRSLAAMPAEAQATLEELQPYHTFGGFQRDPLWRLRELAAAEPLRLAAGALRDDAALGVNTQRHVEITGVLRAQAGAFENGSIVASVAARVTGPDPKLDLFLRPGFELALDRNGPARGGPLTATLAAICDYVEQVVFVRLEA